jgi:hypothetical protein
MESGVSDVANGKREPVHIAAGIPGNECRNGRSDRAKDGGCGTKHVRKTLCEWSAAPASCRIAGIHSSFWQISGASATFQILASSIV